MRISYKWLQDYVDLDGIAPRELADRLTLMGLEVDAVEEPGLDITKVYTGKIIKIDAHPNADKLVVCRIDVGGDETLQIVTGATNVREGHIVPVAVVGAKLAGGLAIKKAKLRGVESRGMLCSGAELGLDPKSMPEEQAQGVMILSADTPVGVDIIPLLGLDDVIIELELTPNRGDCMSMIGVAREVAAILGRPLRMPRSEFQTVTPGPGDKVQVDIEEIQLCRRYVARLLKNVRVGPSPDWMQKRLRAVNVRPINNVVDVTNYVMMELGQPLHAFDYHKLKDGHIIVRRAREGEIMYTLDKDQRKLTSDMLVIADPGGPVAVAGVMGGLDSEVEKDTTAVLLESAYFHPTSIRRTSRALGLRSESSARFEKGVNLVGCLDAADRAAGLLVEMGAAEAVAVVVDNYPVPATDKTILLRPEKVNNLLDLSLSAEEIKELLERLQFQVRENVNGEEGLMVTVPSYRPDVTIEVDLIEEVARIYGVNRIPNTLPTGVMTRGARTFEQVLALRVKNFLAQGGFSEVVTYSFVNPNVFDKLGIPGESSYRQVVAVQNPLSEEQSVMRTLLYPGLLEVLQRNSNRQVNHGAIFELGRLFFPREEGALPNEVPALAAAVTGLAPGGWNAPAQTMDFYFLKGVLEALLEKVGTRDVSFLSDQDVPGFHPGRTATVWAGERQLGIIGEVHPDVQEAYDLSMPVILFELDFNVLTAVAGKPKRYKPLPKFPGVERDLAVVVGQLVPAAGIIEKIYQSGDQELLQSVRVFDVYSGQQVEQGMQSIAFKLNFQARDRTLTDDEVNLQIKSIVQALEQDFGATLRQ